MRRASLKAPSLTALLLAGTAGGAFAQAILQDAPEGSLLTATISERFEIDDNYRLDDNSPGTSYFADTRLAVDYVNRTDTQTLAFGFNTGLRALWEAEEDFDFVVASPSTADLAYENEWANGAFDAAFSFRQRQVDYTIDADPLIPDPTPDDLNQLSGDSRELRYDADIGVVWGTATRSSYELRFTGTQFDYTEDTPDQVSRTILRGQGAWNLQLTPVLASTLTADYLTYSADNTAETEVDRSQVGAGLIYNPSEVLTVGAGLNYAERERTDLRGGNRVSNRDSGPGITANFRYVLPDIVVAGNGEWTTAAPEDRFFGSVRASYVLPRGRINGRLFQNYTGTSGGGNEARVVGAALELVRDINQLSRFGLDFSYALQIDVEDGTGDDADDPDINRMTVTATYSRDLTAYVSADVGYSYSARDEDPNNASSNSVFFQIARSFDTLR